MSYIMRDYQGNELTVTDTQAANIASVSGLLEIDVNGETYYINPKNVSGLDPVVKSKLRAEDYV